jgi:hypothetical protein|tara:strand:+ start:785 stop:1030 length:246 start_codon:yes stop_codon:yes gene_type:complete
METFLSIAAIVLALYSTCLSYMCHKDLKNTEKGLIECATLSRINKIGLETLQNQVNAPKPKRGRPRKNAPKPHTIVHELGN